MADDLEATFDQAINDELQSVRERPGRDSGDELLGLAFSGGGIRSATFCLGVLQGLEKLGLLGFVDYLSTVSGGGYIGSWYLSCLKEQLNDRTQRKAATKHLRRFSRYLAPQAGFFSADTWTIAMVWLRNTLVLQAMLASLFAVLLLSPRFFEFFFLSDHVTLFAGAAAALFIVAAVQIVYRLRRMKDAESGEASAESLDAQGWLQILVVLPLLCAGACFASALYWAGQPEALLWGAFGLVASATFCAVRFSLLPSRRRWFWFLGAAAIGGLCGALFAGLAYRLHVAYSVWKAQPYGSSGPWWAGMLGAPALLAALGLTVILQIGLMGRAIDDSRREWWSRLGAFLGIYSVAALILSLAGVYSPTLVDILFARTMKWVGGSLTLGGIAATLSGLFAARSPETGGNGKSTLKELLAGVAPFVFVVGLMILVSAGLHWAVTAYSNCGCGDRWKQLTCSINEGIFWQHLWSVLGICCGVLALLTWRVDINEASMNPFYRNRLVRCYMGAARAAKNIRHPNLFTGFDFADDYPLAALKREKGYQGPIPIVNTALNLTGQDNAALEERRATSFFFTPYQSGSKETGLVETGLMGKSAGGMRLGACVATSGAAASPNMGYHTSAPVAFLMTFFNVRLGLWLRNPMLAARRQSPRWGLYYLLKELFATADVKDHYLYLSDGGHFENLGVYELIRRRCRYIIACDAEEDGKLVMEALGGLVRKSRIDFDVEIKIDTSQIRRRDEKELSRAHCAVGRIIYDPNKRDEDGYLIYLKSSLTGDEDSDILQYKAQHSAFPHESTGDQFFTESQFESYRALGDHVVMQAFKRQSNGNTVQNRSQFGQWMKSMQETWAPPSPFTEAHFAHHAEQLNHLWNEIRKEEEVTYLDKQLFPGWDKGDTDAQEAKYGPHRRGLYLCQTLIQLMENVYLDLNFETEWEHPDNKGWRVLFTQWAQAPIVREAYHLAGDTFGSRFQHFCSTQLNLTRDG